MPDEDELVNSCTTLHNGNMMLAVLLLRCMQRRRTLRREVERNRESFQCCRTCMSREDLQPIFGEDETPEKMTEQLRIASGVEIIKNDGLPQQICTNCINSMNEAINFRTTCKKTEGSLLGLGFKKVNNETVQELAIDEQLESDKEKKLAPKKKKRLIRKSKKRKRYANNNETPFVTISDDDEHFDNLEDDSCPNVKLVELYHKSPSNLNVVKRKEEIVVPVSLKCTVCEKILKNKHTYIRHMVTHSGDYPYMCEQCGKGLMAYTHLLTHMKAKHGWERTDKCSYCGYLALNKSILQIHERRHTGEKPFVCDHCGMGFHRRANLLQHLPVHLSVKTVQCNLCPSAFKSIRFLRTHYNKKHKQKKYTYICHICKNYFKTTGNVRMHLFRIHGVPKEDQGPVHRVMLTESYINCL